MRHGKKAQSLRSIARKLIPIDFKPVMDRPNSASIQLVSMPAVMVTGQTATQNSPFCRFFTSGGQNQHPYSLHPPKEG